MANRLFEKFEILECLKSDIATVYIAHHIYLDKKILLKTLDKRNITDPDLLARFQREAKTLARLDHPNIIKVLDFGSWEQFFYISFEYFQSKNLRQLLTNGQISHEIAQAILPQIAQGLWYAHQNGVIHRDLKPENILIDATGQVKIADFGLALIKDDPKVTMQSGIVGTPGYMSPEQIRGEKLDERSDIFSLGVITFELFAGKNPFLGNDIGQTLNNILSTKTVPEWCIELPDKYCKVCQGMLHPNRKLRYLNMHQVLNALGYDPNTQTTQILIYQPQPRRFKWLWMLLPIGVAALLIFYMQKSEYSIHDSMQTLSSANSDSLQQIDSLALHHEAKPENQIVFREEQPVSATTEHENSTPPPISMGSLSIRCSPWAYINIDDKFIDTTPVENPIRLQAGEHTLVLKHSDYPPYTKKIRISPNRMLTVAVNLDTLFGYVRINVYPWAEIELDNQQIGRTPLQGPIALQPGKHLLVAKNQYYNDHTEEIFISKNDTLDWKFNYEEIIQ